MEDSSSSHTTQTILSTECPDTWFIDTHPPFTPPTTIAQLSLSKQAAKKLFVPQDNNDNDDNDDIQVVPHPWTYPEHHQEIVGRPTAWLGGYTYDKCSSTTPVRRTKQATFAATSSAPNTPSRSRPEPIHIEGITSLPVKNSPFLR